MIVILPMSEHFELFCGAVDSAIARMLKLCRENQILYSRPQRLLFSATAIFGMDGIGQNYRRSLQLERTHRTGPGRYWRTGSVIGVSPRSWRGKAGLYCGIGKLTLRRTVRGSPMKSRMHASLDRTRVRQAAAFKKEPERFTAARFPILATNIEPSFLENVKDSRLVSCCKNRGASLVLPSQRSLFRCVLKLPLLLSAEASLRTGCRRPRLEPEARDRVRVPRSANTAAG